MRNEKELQGGFWMPSLHGVNSASARSLFVVESRVHHLLGASGPSNVARLVIAVIVYSLKRHLWRRSTANVRNKGRETLPPFTADLNSTGAVVAVLGVVFIVAALIHPAPEHVFWRSAQAVLPYGVNHQASARTRGAFSKALPINIALSSTDASTQEMASTFARRRLSDDDPSANRGSRVSVIHKAHFNSFDHKEQKQCQM